MFQLLNNDSKLSPTAAQLVFLEQYETTYGIFDHNSAAAGPLSTVGFHPTEDTSNTGLFESYLDDFETFKIKEWCTFEEFLNLPKSLVPAIISYRKKLMARRQAEEDKIKQELDKLDRQSGG